MNPEYSLNISVRELVALFERSKNAENEALKNKSAERPAPGITRVSQEFIGKLDTCLKAGPRFPRFVLPLTGDERARLAIGKSRRHSAEALLQVNPVLFGSGYGLTNKNFPREEMEAFLNFSKKLPSDFSMRKRLTAYKLHNQRRKEAKECFKSASFIEYFYETSDLEIKSEFKEKIYEDDSSDKKKITLKQSDLSFIIFDCEEKETKKKKKGLFSICGIPVGESLKWIKNIFKKKEKVKNKI